MSSKTHTFGLFVQQLADQDRSLVLGQVAGLRAGNRRFAPREVTDLCNIRRVKPPANVPSSLRRASERDLVRSYARGVWALTPKGDEYVHSLLKDINIVDIEVALASEGMTGAFLANAEHALLPPTFAPPRWAPGISRMLERFPFEQNVFCMTRFPTESENDPLAPAIDVARTTCAKHGLQLHLASEHQFDDDLLGNVGSYMWACRFGVGIAEDRVGRGLNENTLVELGAMVVTGRRCTILRDVTVNDLPSDLAGHIYKSVDLEDPATVSQAVTEWVRDDLGFQPLAYDP